jgi:uncharacterized protein
MEIERIKLIIRPNAASNSIEGLFGDRIKIRIAGQPEKGRANRILISFISKKTGIPKKDISILSGAASNLKEIAIRKESNTSIFLKLLDEQANIS